MPGDSDHKPLASTELKGPAQDFFDFCKEEKDRRRNSGQAFDEAAFDAAVEIVRRKLQALAGEDPT
jgi:hypothetical protein